MAQLVIEHPDPVASLEEAQDRISEMIRQTEERIRKASEAAVNNARVDNYGADDNWAADAADANVRWTALVDAWEATTGELWNKHSRAKLTVSR